VRVKLVDGWGWEEGKLGIEGGGAGFEEFKGEFV